MEAIDFLLNDDVDWIMTLFLCVFTQGFALFYTVIFSAFYVQKIKPKWLFFALFPSLLILTKILAPKYVLFAIVCMFAGLILALIIGMLKKMISSIILRFKTKRKGETNRSIALELLINFTIIIITIICFFTLGHYTFIFIFIYVGVQSFIKFNSKNSFINIQANLPTSNIASMAMGLVEVTGQVRTKEPLVTRIGKKECVGYRYKIEKRHKRKEGKDSYTTISDEVTCNPFILEDKTGKVEIRPDEIEFKWVVKDDSYSSNGKRYTQYVLYDNDTILLVGKANSKAGTVFIEKESVRNVFALSPFNKVTKWNRYKPLLNSFLSFMTILLVCIAFVLISDIKLVENTLIFNFNLSWDSLNFKTPFK